MILPAPQLSEDAPAKERGAGKLLDYKGAIALVIANTIGTGVFTTSGFALSDLGERHYVLLAWLAGGLYALAGVIVYADLAEQFPQTGGEYVFLRRLLHPALGVVAGWISLVAGFTAPIAAAALGAELYFSRVLGSPAGAPWIASIIVIVLALLHAGAPKQGVAFQNIAVAIKVVAIVAFILFGTPGIIEQIREQPTTANMNFSPMAFAGALVWISFAYSGWNAAVYVAGDIEGGGSTVKRALYTGTFLVTVLYLGVSAVILYGAPINEIKGVADSGAVAALYLGGKNLERSLSGLISLALITSASSMLVTGPRVYAQMARDRVLPQFMGLLHGEHPRVAILIQAALCLLVIWIASLRDILDFVGVTLSLSAGMVVIAWLNQELRTRANLPRIPQTVAALSFLLTTSGIAWATLTMRPWSAVAALILISAGLVAYAMSSKPTISESTNRAS
jgi:amino acid transporter